MRCAVLAMLIVLLSVCAAAEKKYVVTAPGSSAPCNAIFNSGQTITLIPPNQALEVLETKTKERKTREGKISATYFKVRYCGIEGWMGEGFTTGKTFDSPPAGAATSENPLKLLFAKRVDNIRKVPNGPILGKTWELECYEYEAKEGSWYKLKLFGDISGYVHESVVVSEEEGRKMVLAAVAKQQKLENETPEEKGRRVLDEFIKKLNEIGKESGAQIVSNVGVKSPDGESWIATLTVVNEWHLTNYQSRLQCAQGFQSLWASIASPKDPNKAKIKVVDFRGNEVGGSRWGGGTLIWVQDK